MTSNFGRPCGDLLAATRRVPLPRRRGGEPVTIAGIISAWRGDAMSTRRAIELGGFDSVEELYQAAVDSGFSVVGRSSEPWVDEVDRGF